MSKLIENQTCNTYDIKKDPATIIDLNEQKTLYFLKSSKSYYCLPIARRSISLLVAIVTQIAIENVKISHQVLAVISLLLNVLYEDDKLKQESIGDFRSRLCNQSNLECF